MPNPDKHEVIFAAGSVIGQRRKLVLFACYMPPNLSRTQAEKCMFYITELIVEAKKCFRDPLLCIIGDFNQWKLEDYLDDFPDVAEVPVGPTRGSREIERIFVYFKRSVKDSGTFAPLETGDSASTSDHQVVFCRTDLVRREAFKWETYEYRHYTAQAEESFKAWIVMHNWKEVFEAEGSNDKTKAYQTTLTDAINSFFPLKRMRKKLRICPG